MCHDEGSKTVPKYRVAINFHGYMDVLLDATCHKEAKTIVQSMINTDTVAPQRIVYTQREVGEAEELSAEPTGDNESNIDDRRYYDLRVYIIEAGVFDFRGKEREGKYQEIMDEAEENGLVYTLDEFVDAVNSEEADNFSTSWILIR